MFTETQKNFLSSFGTIEGIEVNNLKEIVKEVKDTENVYFLAGGNPNKRNHDTDITEKNYIVFDFDIRKHFRENEDYEINDDEIKEIGNFLGNFLITDGKYGLEQWKYIVFSGNGLHLYYVGETLKVPQDITAREYQAAVKLLYETFEKIVDAKYLVPDYACRNIARIMRLPGSVNQKTGKRVEILAERDIYSSIISKLPIYGKKRLEQETELNELRAKKYVLEEKNRLLKGENNKMMERILSYPIELILMGSGIIPISGFKNGKNFVDPRDSSYYGFYKGNGNFLVVGGSTTLAPYSNGKEGIDSFGLAKSLYNLSDADTFKYFEKLFANLSRDD